MKRALSGDGLDVVCADYRDDEMVFEKDGKFNYLACYMLPPKL